MLEFWGMKKSEQPDITRIDPSQIIAKLLEGLSRVIKGKQEFLEKLVTCFITGGHLLIEDVPGLGKTTVAKTLARLISGGRKNTTAQFKRIQFTPDLLPYDITGVDIFNPQSGKFTFHPGPVFTNILLADEINRTTPKVQSALLEVMAEQQVTIGNNTHSLENLFFVIATQNPLEIEGTYPLPLAQLDRFMMRLSLGYPDEESELTIVRENPSRNAYSVLTPLCTMEEILALRKQAELVHCDPTLTAAAVETARRTRGVSGIDLGVSPRGALMLVQAARGYALLRGRDYVIDQDLADLLSQVYLHRMRFSNGSMDGAVYLREVFFDVLKKCPY